MRIISGKFKGRRIQAPKKLPVRPTTDMAKEALFNIINNEYYFDEITVLDLFAGIGSIAYEFASRGTQNIVCIDDNFGCINFIENTADEFDMPIKCIKSDVFKYLQTCDHQYNIVFADPPYIFSDDLFKKIHNLVFENNLLDNEGILIIEHSKHTDLALLENYLNSRIYGGNMFSFFKK